MYYTTSFIHEKACLSLQYIKEYLIRYWNGKVCVSAFVKGPKVGLE